MKNASALKASLPSASRLTWLATFWAAFRAALRSVRIERRIRRLRLCESLPLGEKRLIAVVEFEDQRFLLAATPEHVSLLQTLGSAPPPESHPPEHV